MVAAVTTETSEVRRKRFSVHGTLRPCQGGRRSHLRCVKNSIKPLQREVPLFESMCGTVPTGRVVPHSQEGPGRRRPQREACPGELSVH